MPTSPRPDTPRGEAAVRAALLAAGAELFAERGPAAVSVRQVAAAAGVNHGLVHRHFGGKDGLVAAVLDDLAEQALPHGPDDQLTRSAAGPLDRHTRILAHVLLAGGDPLADRDRFPGMDAVVAGYRAQGLPDGEARRRAVVTMALVLGWQLFEPFLVGAAGLDGAGRSTAGLLDDALARLARP